MTKKFKACPERSRRVFVAMSGGVDSSVAAALLKQEGYEVVGVHMKCFNVDGCAAGDAEDARRAAEALKIPFYVFDFEKEYKGKVVDYMVEGYKKGITPNPDVMCNKEIKFGLFLKKALSMGADFVATGHYVRLRQTAFQKQHNPPPAGGFASLSPRHPSLRLGTKLAGLRDVPQSSLASPLFSMYVARDINKDQSYFLWTLTQRELKYCLFPVGDYLKPEVRKIAKKFKLPNADKKDSQGICFLGRVPLREFLGNYIPKKKGIVVSEKGEVLGEHEGAHFYTIGQRHGFGGGGGKSRYVAEKDVESNAILAVEGGSNPLLYKKEVSLKNINLISQQPTAISHKQISMRVRYRQPVFKAKIVLSGKKAKVVFDKPQKFVASGQSAVFYNNKGEMLGGGIIV